MTQESPALQMQGDAHQLSSHFLDGLYMHAAGSVCPEKNKGFGGYWRWWITAHTAPHIVNYLSIMRELFFGCVTQWVTQSHNEMPAQRATPKGFPEERSSREPLEGQELHNEGLQGP